MIIGSYFQIEPAGIAPGWLLSYHPNVGYLEVPTWIGRFDTVELAKAWITEHAVNPNHQTFICKQQPPTLSWNKRGF